MHTPTQETIILSDGDIPRNWGVTSIIKLLYSNVKIYASAYCKSLESRFNKQYLLYSTYKAIQITNYGITNKLQLP